MKGVINWFVGNPIAANILMLLILIGGYLSTSKINMDFFPPVNIDVIEVSVPYRGAGPKEVEEQISNRIEEVVHDLDGVDEIDSYSREGAGAVMVKVASGYDTQVLINDIKTRVDSITTFPVDSERPQVRRIKFENPNMILAVYGDVEEKVLKSYGQILRDELSALPDVGKVDLVGARAEEVSIEVSEEVLRRHRLSFEDVVAAIRTSSLNLPAGQLRTQGGDIQLRTQGQAYDQSDFESIVVLHKPDGTQVTLGEVAEVKDGFERLNFMIRFDGQPAVYVNLQAGNDPNIIKSSIAVREYLQQLESTLPEGLNVTIWNDFAVPLAGRINLLLNNALGGLFLVFALLMLFLRPILAMWVAIGIGVAYMGALWLMPSMGLSLNIISMFSFLLILGIVVDDAIVVGESVHAHYERGLPGNEAAVLGAKNVLKPVVLAVTTTLMAFFAMILIDGTDIESFKSLAYVPLLALVFSLIESFLILPAHLRNMKPEREPRNNVLKRLHHIRLRFADGMKRFIEQKFSPFINVVLRHRRATLTAFVGAFLISMTLFSAGWLQMRFFPEINGELLMAKVEMESGVPFEETLQIIEQLDRSLAELIEEPIMKGPNGEAVLQHRQVMINENKIDYNLMLLGAEQVERVGTRVIQDRWEELLGPVARAENVEFSAELGPPRTADITMVLQGRDRDQLAAASRELTAELLRYPGVGQVFDSLRSGKQEMQVSLKPGAESLGIGLSDVARQIRQAFYGEEAQRIPRLNDDVRVMVRYPEQERDSLSSLGEFRIRTQDGRELPFDAVAEANFIPGVTQLQRQDRLPMVQLSANVTSEDVSSSAIAARIQHYFDTELQASYPGVTLKPAGDLEAMGEFLDQLGVLMALLLLAIYGLLAVLFRSYWQPFVILTAVPFGVAGAFFGHFITGMPVAMFSFFGILAAMGVVVNDNLVLIDRINHLRSEGWAAFDAVKQGAIDRFRPIVLTSVTTFFGLMPILLEPSTQAQFLKPAVVSLSFGVLFATFVTLLLVPCVYLMGENIKERFYKRRGDKPTVVAS